jgi:hypothetical protein
MFSPDTNPEHDRAFADVAPRLAEWHRLTSSTPSLLERAWLRAGYGIDDAHDLNGWYIFVAGGEALVFLPARSAGNPVQRAAILARVVADWEKHGHWAALAPLCGALALVAAEDYGDLAAQA